MDHGDGVGGEVAGVEDDEVRGVGGAVVDEVEEPAVVLGGAVGVGREHRLAADVVVAVAVLGGAAVTEVVLDHALEAGAGLGESAGVGHVAVAVGPAGQVVVDAGEVARAVVEGALGDRARGEVEAPAVQVRERRWLALRLAEADDEVVGAATVDHHGVTVVPAVEEVVGVEGIDLEPPHVGVAAVAGHHADAGAVVGRPTHDGAAVQHPLDVEDRREVEEHGVALGDHEVVHHHGSRQVDRRVVGHGPGRVELVVVQIGRGGAGAEEAQPPGVGVELRVGGHRADQPAVEVGLAEGDEVGIELGGRPGLPEGEQAPGVADDVGVGRVLHHADLGHQVGVG